VCSACSVVGFSAGNSGQSLGFANHGNHRNHGKRRHWFPCVRRVLWLNSRLVTGDSPWVLLTTEYTEHTEKEGALISVCSACSVVGFLAGNSGQSLGLLNHVTHGKHGKKRRSFPCVRRVPWLNSRPVTGDSP